MNGGDYKIFEDSKHSIEEPNSNFNQHRREVIKYAIEKNLSTAIANFNNYTNSTNNFQMPKLKETEWDKILNHISIISFLQGLNIGGKVYNGYSIITNTKNKEVVSEDAIYILTNDGYYHSPLEKELKDNLYRGILNIDLERKSYRNGNNTLYYYPTLALGSYSSIVSQNDVEAEDSIYEYLDKLKNDNRGEELAKLYYTALARERYEMYRTDNPFK